MFETHDRRHSLGEEVFDQWLENGRLATAGYHYLVVIWDEYDVSYKPHYAAAREDVLAMRGPNNRETFVAAYDLYSESRIL